MHFGSLTFWLLRKFLNVHGWKGGISHSHYESTDIFHHVMRTGLPLYGSSKNASLPLFHPEFFDSKFYNCRIQSRKLGFGVNIKSRKKAQNHWCAHTIPCNKTSKSREAISAAKLEFPRLYIRYNHEIKTLMHFGTLAFGVHTNFVDIGGWKRGISQSRYECTDII